MSKLNSHTMRNTTRNRQEIAAALTAAGLLVFGGIFLISGINECAQTYSKDKCANATLALTNHTSGSNSTCADSRSHFKMASLNCAVYSTIGLALTILAISLIHCFCKQFSHKKDNPDLQVASVSNTNPLAAQLLPPETVHDAQRQTQDYHNQL